MESILEVLEGLSGNGNRCLLAPRHFERDIALSLIPAFLLNFFLSFFPSNDLPKPGRLKVGDGETPRPMVRKPKVDTPDLFLGAASPALSLSLLEEGKMTIDSADSTTNLSPVS